MKIAIVSSSVFHEPEFGSTLATGPRKNYTFLSASFYLGSEYRLETQLATARMTLRRALANVGNLQELLRIEQERTRRLTAEGRFRRVCD